MANAFLEAVTPAALDTTLLTVQQLQAHHDAALAQWRLEVERARYEAERAERRMVEPEHRLVARGLETEWEARLRDLSTAEAELTRREHQQPRALSPEPRRRGVGEGAGFELMPAVRLDRALLPSMLRTAICNPLG